MEIGIQYVIVLGLLVALSYKYKWALVVTAIIMAVPLLGLMVRYWNVLSVLFIGGFVINIVPAFFNKDGKTLYRIFKDA